MRRSASLPAALANLVLRVADAAVQKVDDGQLFYARFCDDVVFVHPSEEGCRRALEAYAVALRGLDLPLHPVEDFVYRPADGSATEYFSIKSKRPFRWRAAEVGERGCAPCVSFLGSQIRYDGETRIRKESIEKHVHSLGRETAAALREIKDGKVGGALGAARPTVMSWFARFRNRLIAKGVGYVTAKVQVKKSVGKSDKKSGKKSDKKILEHLKSYPSATLDELQELTGLSSGGIRKAIRRLKDARLLLRVGPDKGGHWEVLEVGDGAHGVRALPYSEL